MAGPVIAVTDSVFPSLDPAKAALSGLNPTYRMAKSANADDILAVAKDADAILVTYAKLTREILTQLTRCRHGAVGLWRQGTMIGYTSCGLGVSPPAVRFNCRGEVTVITLRVGH